MTLHPNIVFLSKNFYNAYLIVGPHDLTLVDAMGEGNDTDILAQIRRAGYDPADLKRVLITHAHPDHVGALPKLLDMYDLDVWVSRRDAPIVRGEQGVPRRPAEDLGVVDRLVGRFFDAPMAHTPVYRELDDDEALDEVLPGLRTVALAGHSPGQLGFWLPSERVLLGGDVMMNLPWPIGPRLPLASFTPDPVAALRSILNVAGLKPHTLALGHGAPITNNAHQKLAPFFARVHRMLPDHIEPSVTPPK